MTKEEVIIALGLDQAGVKTGLGSTDFLIQNSIGDTLRSLKRLVSINMVSMAFSAVDVWKSATKSIAESWFMLEQQMTRGGFLEKQRQMWRTLRKEAEMEDADRAREARISREVAKVSDIWAAVGKGRVKELEAERELLKLKQQQANLDKERLKATELGVAIKKLDLEITQATMDEQEEIRRNTKEQLEFGEKLKREREKPLKEAREASASSAKRLEAAQRGRLEFTLDDMMREIPNTVWGRQAGQIDQLQNWARQNAMFGNFDLAKSQAKRADQLFDDLKKQNPFLRDPLGDLKTEAAEQNNKLQEILSKGLMIRNSE